MPLARQRLGSGVKQGGAAWVGPVCWDDVGVVWPSPSSACQSQGHKCLGGKVGNRATGGKVRGQHLPGVARLRCLISRRLLLLDGRGLEDRQWAEAAACGGHQRGPQGSLPLGTGPRLTVWKRDCSNESQ